MFSSEKPVQPKGSDVSPSDEIGRLAIVAIGNPLLEEDSAASTLISFLLDKQMDQGNPCLFSFDSGFAWLKQVFMKHRSIIIVDSIVDTGSAQEGYLKLPLTKEILEHSGFSIRATHGMSWLDEIKLIELSTIGSLTFFGIDGYRFKALNSDERTVFITTVAQAFSQVLDECNSMNLISRSDNRYA